MANGQLYIVTYPEAVAELEELVRNHFGIPDE